MITFISMANWAVLAITIVFMIVLFFKASFFAAVAYIIVISICHALIEWLIKIIMSVTTTQHDRNTIFLAGSLSTKDMTILTIGGIVNVIVKLLITALFYKNFF